MRASKKREFNTGRPLEPQPRRSVMIRGVEFYTRNLGATDQFTGQFVWFAVGSWTHDDADGVFSSLEAAVADRFGIWEDLGYSYAPKFRTEEQLANGQALEDECRMALGNLEA